MASMPWRQRIRVAEVRDNVLSQISGVFVPFVIEIDLAKIALSCHFALYLFCCKEGAHDFA